MAVQCSAVTGVVDFDLVFPMRKIYKKAESGRFSTPLRSIRVEKVCDCRLIVGRWQEIPVVHQQLEMK